MPRWLLKTEPGAYSFEDLARDGRTVWDGVTNPLALKHIRAMAKGDEIVVYHTGSERRAIGLARVTRAPFPDPKAGDPKIAVVEIEAVGPLPRPVTLDRIRSDPSFAGWDLLRLSRLSVVPIPDPFWRRLMALAKS